MSTNATPEITLAEACLLLGRSETTLRKYLPHLEHRYDPQRGCRVVSAADVQRLRAQLDEERAGRGNWRARNLGAYARPNRPSVPSKGNGRATRASQARLRAPHADDRRRP